MEVQEVGKEEVQVVVVEVEVEEAVVEVETMRLIPF